MTIENKETEQNYNQGKSFSGGIDVQLQLPTLIEKILAANSPVSDAIASTYVTNSTGIDFNAISSPTNGQGLYINDKENVVEDLTVGTIKYFRGGTYCAYTTFTGENTSGAKCLAVGGTWDSTTYHCSLHDSKSLCESKGFTYYELKNNVIFGGFAWKIIRINADGSIRMIFNGSSPTSRGANAIIGTSTFNPLHTDNTYIGYMYGGAGLNTYGLTHANINNSAVKGIIDTWYANNMTNKETELVDAGFCGDRSLISGLGYKTNETYYGAYPRLYTNKTPTFDCSQTNDLYTLPTNNVGNKKLTYPIGLITIDEAMYAGGKVTNYNFTYYLQTGTNGTDYTMSPTYFSTNAYVAYISQSGSLSGYITSDVRGVHPVINISSETIITNGSGTLTDPWVIQKYY